MDDKKPEIPEEHQLKCERCGEIIDKRDLGEVLTHGFNECIPVQTDYSTSKKVGDSVEWTKDKKRIDLN